jgi:hypothetical protein
LGSACVKVDVEAFLSVPLLSQHSLLQKEQQLDFILKCAHAPSPPMALVIAITKPAMLVASTIVFFIS